MKPTTANQWTIANFYLTSINGSIWTTGESRNAAFQLGIYATPVPEPETGALICLGLAGLGLCWLKR